MGYNKTDSSKDSFSALMRWARRIRDKLHHERGGLLIRKEDREKDEEKNGVDVRNN